MSANPCLPAGNLVQATKSTFSSQAKAAVLQAQSRRDRHLRAQQGFSLVEVSIVTAIVLLLAVIGIPAIGSYLIENKVPRVGEEIVRFILHAQVGGFDGTATPYASMTTDVAARYLEGSSVLNVREAAGATRILHGLGTNGEVTVAAYAGGTAFSIVLDRVNHVACPSIASVLQRVVDSVSLAPEGQSSIVLKDDTQTYSALTAQSRCSKGDNNTFTVVVS